MLSEKNLSLLKLTTTTILTNLLIFIASTVYVTKPKLVFALERSNIEGKEPEKVAEILTEAFNKYC